MKIDMKKMMVLVGVVALAGSVWAFNKSMYAYEVPAGGRGESLGCIEAKAGMELEPGKWYTNFWVCKDYADKHGLPMVAIWSNHLCIHCWYTDINFIQEDFLAWKETHDAGKVIYCFMSGGEGSLDQANSTAYNWMWYGGGTKLNSYPFVVLWWAKEGVNERYTGDKFCDTTDLTERSIPARVVTIEGRLEKAFAKWVAPVQGFAGGSFADPDTEENRLEFEDGTTNVTIRLSREANQAATNVALSVCGPTGAELSRQTIAWAADQTAATAEIAVSNTWCMIDGQKLSLYLQADGVNWATNHITYVRREASTANPLWKGEAFGFGEWTCDIDAAKTLAQSVDGEAYTLVSIQGSMWCPDCANTDRNFLNVTNGAGENAFAAWARSKNVALVSMDIPNYNGTNATDFATPTLFTTNAYATTLARAREWPASGAEASLTNAITRSGLGYLTRKGVSAADAAAIQRRFHDLAYNNTDKGGFHRPEDGNKNRTGVPIFVLLRKDGSVAARFTRFAAVSPMAADKANFDNYIKRFEEMLAIASATGVHADATEIENNYPGSGAIAFVANGGAATNELCNADMQDAFRLDGVGGNAAQRVVVSGDSGAEVLVQFWKKNADGTYAEVGEQVRGHLNESVSLTNTFTESGEYYLLVKGASITNAEYAAASATANNFTTYTVTGGTVLVPQGDQVTANAPAGSDEVYIQLVADQVYRFAGVTTNDNPIFQEVGSSGAYKLLKATVSGIQKVKLSTGPGGVVVYQLWQPGQVGFTTTGRSVSESVNDLRDDWVEFRVMRTGGKSGWVKARVTVDLGKTTLAPARYEFQTNALNAADFEWDDGVTSNQTVRVKIIDDLLYDGDYKIVFNLEVLSSDAGDATVVANRGVFTLNVLEDDKSEPGRGLITRTTPDCTAKGTVYARESEGAKIWVQRVEACAGLVVAELKSSRTGVSYETEDVRDITNILGRTGIYWSDHEMTEKYVRVTGIPAGKSAKIQLCSFGDFKTIAASNTVTVVAVADDAPAFAKGESAFNLYRYVAATGTVSVAVDAATLQGGSVSFRKVSGTLPAGLKVVYDSAAKALVVSGVPTAKQGVYDVVYQVVETRSGLNVSGLTTRITFTVVDPTDAVKNPELANPAIAKSRTFKDIAVVNPVNQRMAGVLQLTIPTRGNLSGKYFCESGTIALSGRNWADFNAETKGISAALTSRSGIMVGVTANADGSLDVAVSDPMYPGVQLDATVSGLAWSKANTAESWKGYYTVAMPVEQVVTNETENVAPTGSGYLTIDFSSKSAWNTGTAKWAGMLPNGTKVSGSSVMSSPYSAKDAAGENALWVRLPVFKISSTDTLSVYARMLKDAASVKDEDRRAVLSVDGVVSCWSHGETRSELADYLVNLGVYGAIYDKTEDLGGCCREYYGEKGMWLSLVTTNLVDTSYGEPTAISPLEVEIGEDSVSIKSGQSNPAGVTVSLNRETGIVSGSFELTCGATDVRASYRGVVLTGWGEGCGCGPTAGMKIMPFINGSHWFADKMEYATKRTMTVKRGGLAVVDIIR